MVAFRNSSTYLMPDMKSLKMISTSTEGDWGPLNGLDSSMAATLKLAID